MKKLNLLLGILIGITIFSCSSESNDNDNGNPEPNLKLIKKITVFENGIVQPIQTWIFDYSNNRLTSLTLNNIVKREFNYSGNNLDFEQRFEYNSNNNAYDIEAERFDFEYENNVFSSRLESENGILTERDDYTLNSEGKTTQIDHFFYSNNQDTFSGSTIYEYSSGSIINRKQTFQNGGIAEENILTFDNNNSPFINLEMDVRRLISTFFFNALSDNNRLTYSTVEVNNNPIFTYSYQYDLDNYPEEVIITRTDSNEEITMIYEYE
jgi:hypothetical protein